MVTNMKEQAKARMRNWSVAAAIASAMIGAGGAFASDAPALVKQLSPGQVQMRLDARKDEGVRVAQLFGESDEEKAARQQHEDSQDARITELSRRVQDLEDSLQRMTGEAEELGHRLDEANRHMSQMQKDFDYKICTLSAQQLGAGTEGGDTGLPCGGQQAQTGAPVQHTATVDTGNGPIQLSPPPGVLGTLPANAVPKSQTANAAPPPTDTRKKFDAAMNLLARAQYDEAAGAFRSFADTYPDDDLAPQAVYWVGDIAYVQKNYTEAARDFAEGIKKYPKSARAPDSMLKLGQSLIAMDQKKEGCTALAALASKYPTAKTEIEQAKAAHKELCR
jgi:tol-pal system protein YbgF